MADEHDSEGVEEENSNKGELTAKQRNNKKKKEAAKKKKQEQREKNEVSDSPGDVAIQESMSPQERLDEELAWCISQLEIGLKVQKPDKTTASHTEQLIKNLKSPKVPLPKKRQIMRSVFGDYRKKIQEDSKKVNLKEPENSWKVFPVKKDQQKSVFLRTVQDNSLSDEAQSTNGLDQTSATDTSAGWKFRPSSEDFKFNFETQQT